MAGGICHRLRESDTNILMLFEDKFVRVPTQGKEILVLMVSKGDLRISTSGLDCVVTYQFVILEELGRPRSAVIYAAYVLSD